jgi:hypothetical protein
MKKLFVFVIAVFCGMISSSYGQSTITSFSPAYGTYKSLIKIRGTFSGDIQNVFFGSRSCSWYREGDSVVNAIIGDGIYPGNISVSVHTTQGTPVKDGFQYYAPVAIDSFSPAYGLPGTRVVIRGSGFNALAAGNEVYFGTAIAAVLSASADSLEVTVPPGAVNGAIQVLANSSMGYSASPFKVTNTANLGIGSFGFINYGFNKPGFIVKQIDAADLDGDGKPEVIALNKDSDTLIVYKNNSANKTLAFSADLFLKLGGVGMEVVAGDIDNDGRADIVVKTNEQNLVSVFRNTSSAGTLSFAARVDMAASSSYENYDQGRVLVVAKIDGDELPEILLANTASRSVGIFRNTGSTDVVSFAPEVSYLDNFDVTSLAVQDFDGDSKADIAFYNSGNYVRVFKNTGTTGNIGFSSTGFCGTNKMVNNLIAGDYDLDGKPDLALLTRDTALQLFRNISSLASPSFNAGSLWKLPYRSVHVDAGDFNGDGRKDMLALNNNYPGTFTIFVNTGAAGSFDFAESWNYTTAFAPAKSIVTDLDHDGKSDILAINGYSSSFLALRNGFNEPYIYSFAPAVAAKDSVITIKGRYFTGTTAVTFGGVAAASFSIANDSTIFAVVGEGASGSVSVTSADSTTEKPGFVFTNWLAVTSFSPNTATAGSTITIKGGRFIPVPDSNVVFFGAVAGTVTAVSDTLLEVVVPAGATYDRLRITSGSRTAYSDQRFVLTFAGATDSLTASAAFAGPMQIPVATQVVDMAGSDLDGDGKTDLVTVHGAAAVHIYQNTGSIRNIAFASPIIFSLSNQPSKITLQDIDGDAKPDLIVTSATNDFTAFFRNTGTPGAMSFASPLYLNTGPTGDKIAIQDLDGDGKSDLVIATDTNNNVQVIRNLSVPGTFNFHFQPVIGLGSFVARKISIEDIDRNEKPDICVSVYWGVDIDVVFVWKNTSSPGNIVFNLFSSIGGDSQILSDMKAGDLDGDGPGDLVLSNPTVNSIEIIRNTSSGGIVRHQTPKYFAAGLQPEDLVLGDLNGNGKPDIAVGNTVSGTISLFDNRSNPGTLLIAGQVELAPATAPRSLFAGDLDGDGKPELALVNYGVDSISIFRNIVGEPQITPSGANPVTGPVETKVTVDETVQVYQGHPYVQRHYDITPANNPSTATATITLYFTQAEFNLYNLHPAHGLNLPTGPNDNAGKANLRVYQYHGFSATSLPGTYSGNGIEIDPDDAKIVWNAISYQWEVTFDVNGFSGFFVGSAGNGFLPLTLLSFTGREQNNSALLKWETTDELNVAWFNLERSTDGKAYTAIARIMANNSSAFKHYYEYKDQLGEAPVYHYRLKITDTDGSFVHSKIVTIHTAAASGKLVLQPNPARDGYVYVSHPSAGNGANIQIADLQGRVVRQLPVGSQAIRTKVAVTGLSSGFYTLIWNNGDKRISSMLIIP